jgi:oxygen-dependent protoporphyrinogen oxidase
MTAASTRPWRVVVIGGGISGLSAAWFLRQRPDPPEVIVIEAAERPGGKLRLGDLGGNAIDAGAESMLARRPEAANLARALGLGDRLESPTTTAAQLLVDGVLRPFPSGTVLGVPGDLKALAASGVLTRRGLLRVRADRVMPSAPQTADVAVGRYVTARLGLQVTERLVEPLLGGVYAGHADQLSLQATLPAIAQGRARGERLTAAAAAIRGATGGTADGSAPFVGLVGGLGVLPERLASTPGVEVRTRTTARQVTRGADGRFLVVCGPVPRPQTLDADAVVVAVPASAAARVLRDAAPSAAALLEVVEYASVAIIALGYRPSAVPARALRGSGHLAPPREGRPVKAATYASQKWAWLRAAVPDLMIVRASVGRQGEVADLQRDDAGLVQLAREDIADTLGITARPQVGSVFRWGGALPQYTVGHTSRARRLHQLVDEVPGLAVCGAAVDGVGIAACIASARVAADQVLQVRDTDATMAR